MTGRNEANPGLFEATMRPNEATALPPVREGPACRLASIHPQ